MNKNTLIIRADANEEIGIGHFMRCLSIACTWEKRGGKAVIVSDCRAPALEKKAGKAEIGIVSLPPGIPMEKELSTLADIIKQTGAHWIVIDGYRFDETYHKAIKACGIRLLLMDDYNHLPFYRCDILVNQNLGADKISYRHSRNTRLLLGHEYTLLRREFTETEPVSGPFPETAGRILVTMGGSDPDNATLTVIHALIPAAKNISVVDIVIGPSNPHLKSIEEAVTCSPLNCRIHVNPGNMAGLMTRADMAVSAGGSTAWELSYLGIPSVFIVTAANQENSVRKIQEFNAGINAGSHSPSSIRELSDTIYRLMSSSTLREELSRQSKRLISGKGGNKIVDAMESYPG
ncbi:MAG: UDP-2,4-diacetamido-2,4,6-trideoxy-beta-L-altropyranose hydrolase [Desulfobacterales bacterium]|nr:UDP-2,4-diacetamido-2,4,6-trideoxy-beta-L-altropyranose hydrolase [Desulfobacterales bacterium]